MHKGDQSSMMKKVSPSPSKKGQAYTKSASQTSYDGRGVRVSPSPPSNIIPGQNIIGFNGLSQQQPQQYNGNQIPTSQTISQENLSQMGVNGPITGMIPSQTVQQQIPMQSGMQNTRWMSPTKQQFTEQQGITVPPTINEPPQYPNPYYSSNQPQKLP